ncbi:membrane protein [Aequorivita vladivostokensis]|uniref:Membrane protein n=1 Tax=Aequorivita vladivostokensis TaxID=171194 RepID=A0ABR5DGJ9_9FLAO|nr:membrane protein [Aequorivita vladivostokensis]KJJ37915.1 membrane protein [Aequorivita vladivostokensis]
MFRQILVGLFILIAGVTVAQEGTTSPYSYYGIGTLKFRGTVENRSMGGLGVFSDSIHLNLQNPASYSGLRLVNFSVGGSHKASTQKNETASQNTSTTTLDYIAMGIPMGKFGMGFGVIPYTAVGYDFNSELPDGLTQYEGSGGLNKAYLSLGYQVTPELSLGVDANYNFGKIENTATTQKNNLQYGTRVFNRSDILGFSFNFGAMYKRMVTEKLEFTGSVTFTPGTSFTSENYRRIATVSILPVGIFTVDEREITVADTDFTFPSQFTVGAGIGAPKHWALGVEYTNQKTSNFTNRSFNIDNITYENASKFRLGGYYIPNYNSFGNYFKRVVYRAGARFEQTGLNVNGQDINEFGISFGLGLPVGRLFSNANLGFEIGRRGTTDFGLIQENFFNTFISFSLNDRWFEKRLYD